MRTKNLNLKKKIAFIASVAMIASTAAYLPAGVSLNADAAVIGATAGNNEVDNFYNADSKPTYPYAATIDADLATDGIQKPESEQRHMDTVYAFVKINGKYLSVNVTDNEYKLTTTADTSLNATWKPVIINKELNEVLVASTDKKFGDLAISRTNDVMKVNANAAAIEIPYVADAKEITLEFNAVSGAIMSDRSVKEISIPLNNYGMGKLNKQQEYVVAMSKNSAYDEDTDTYKTGGAVATESYEVVDLSGLTVIMRKNNLKNDSQYNKSFDPTAAKITSIVGVDDNDLDDYADDVMAFVNGATTILDDEDIHEDTYELKKVGNVYAKVLTYTLKKAVDPDTVIKVDTGVYNQWTASGSNVSKGVVTLSTNKEGNAVSGLVTMTQGSNKEYYVYVVKNPENVLEAENNAKFEAFGGNLKFDLFAKSGAGSSVKNNGTVTIGTKSDAEDPNTHAYYSVPVEFNGNYKIEREIVTEKINLTATTSEKRYVTKYIVYNNQTTDQYDTVGDAYKTVTLTLANAGDDNKIIKADAKNDANTEINDVDDAAHTQTVELKLGSAGTGETAPLEWKYGAGANDKETFIIEFTNQYELKYDEKWDDNREDATKNYDGKVTVSGQNITNPGSVNRPGFKFDGWWMTGANDWAFMTDNGVEQLNETKVTPNDSLYAKYEGLYYNVQLDANGGFFSGNPAGGSLIDYANYPGQNGKVPTKCSFTNVIRNVNNTDIARWKVTNGVTNTNKKFLGWSTSATATSGMSIKELANEFPGENKTLTLYAVWSAEDTSANFYVFNYDDNGAVIETDGKIAKKEIKEAWTLAEKAEFDNAADAYITLEPGEKFGTLPTPYQKGYVFEGWYAAVFNSSKTEVTAERVTEDSIVDAKYFVDHDLMDGTLGTTVNLYAKFTQKQNTITFDIGNGLWANNEIDDEDGSLPAKVLYNAHDKKLTYRRPNGTVIADDVWSAVANPKVGSDEFTKFRSWSINDGKTTYATLAAVKNALDKMDTLDDITVKANYENTNQTQSNIFLNANEGSFYYYLAAENNPTTKKPAKFYQADGTEIGNGTTLAACQKTGLSFGKKATGTKTDTVFRIDGAYAEAISAGSPSWQVARAGYTFTGWYTDKECTQKYTFDVYPSKGTETILYAGWEKSDSVRYWLEYDIFNGDKSEATDLVSDEADAVNGRYGKTLAHRKTFMGTIGEDVSAKDLTINVKDGSGTLTTYTTYKFDPEKSKNLDNITRELKAKFDVAQLANGKLEQVKPYTTIYGRFVEDGFQSEAELTAPTGVNVNGKKVSWTAADGAVKYQIVKVVGDKSYDGATSTTTSAELKSIPDQTFKVQVKAFDKNGNVKISDPVTVQVTALDPATNVAISDDGKVTWTASKKAVKYQILQQFSETDKSYSAYVTDTEYQLNPTDKAFDLYVIAKDANGKAIRSTVVKGQPFGTVTELGKPVNVKYDAATNTVTWDEASNAVKYNVCKIVNGKKYYKAPKAGEKSVTFSSKTAAFGYYVIAYDEAGKTATSAVQYAPGRPTNIKIASDKQTVSFTGVTGAKFYKLKKVSGGKAYYKKVTTTSGKFDTALKAGDKVYVVAFMDEKGTNYVSSAAVTVK